MACRFYSVLMPGTFHRSSPLKTYQIPRGRCFKCATAYFVHILGTDGDAAVHYQANNDGKAMRAVAVDPEAAQLVGINPDHVISFTFALGISTGWCSGCHDRLVLQFD